MVTGLPLAGDSVMVYASWARAASSATVGEEMVTYDETSSSSSVKPTPVTVTVAESTLLDAVPVTVPVRSGSSRLLSTAVITTVSEELLV